MDKAGSYIGCLLLRCSFVKCIPVIVGPVQFDQELPGLDGTQHNEACQHPQNGLRLVGGVSARDQQHDLLVVVSEDSLHDLTGNSCSV